MYHSYLRNSRFSFIQTSSNNISRRTKSNGRLIFKLSQFRQWISSSECSSIFFVTFIHSLNRIIRTADIQSRSNKSIIFASKQFFPTFKAKISFPRENSFLALLLCIVYPMCCCINRITKRGILRDCVIPSPLLVFRKANRSGYSNNRRIYEKEMIVSPYCQSVTVSLCFRVIEFESYRIQPDI